MATPSVHRAGAHDAPPSLSHHTGPLFVDLEHELAATRRMLERVPDGRGDWRPHAKSMTLARLACHLAEAPAHVTGVFATTELDLAGGGFPETTLDTTAEILAHFDRTSAEMCRAIAAADAAAMAETWTLRDGAQVYVQESRGAIVRDWGISHPVHHRAPLGVHLRLLDVPVPGMGPSADES